MVEASCHCGAVKFEIAEPPDEVTDCNCSICRKLGVRWAYYHPDQVRIDAAPDALGAYSWGDKRIAFHHCRNCGCPTHWTGVNDGRRDRMGVSARLMDPTVLKGVRIRKLDGADTWTARFAYEE